MPSESEERAGCRNIADSKRVHLRKQKRQQAASPQFHLGVTCPYPADAKQRSSLIGGTEAREQRYWKRVPTIQTERRREAEASDYRS
jgi:hypothetical protein